MRRWQAVMPVSRNVLFRFQWFTCTLCLLVIFRTIHIDDNVAATTRSLPIFRFWRYSHYKFRLLKIVTADRRPISVVFRVSFILQNEFHYKKFRPLFSHSIDLAGERFDRNERRITRISPSFRPFLNTSDIICIT